MAINEINNGEQGSSVRTKLNTVIGAVNGNVTGSYTGSFTGDGSGLSNIPSSGIVGDISAFQIASGAATASISPDTGFSVNVDSHFTGSMDVSGSITLDGTATVTTLTETSKRELKENIYPIDSQVENIQKLNPVSFNFIGQSKTHFGFIVDEVEPIYPEFISNDEKGINYSKMVSVLVKAVQELKQEINNLKTEIKR